MDDENDEIDKMIDVTAMKFLLVQNRHKRMRLDWMRWNRHTHVSLALWCHELIIFPAGIGLKNNLRM